MNSIIQKPWGSYQNYEEGKNYLVKKIFVKPGGKLSLQSHNHRSEHWIVVTGNATITIDKSKSTLKPNDNIFIPKRTKHRLENVDNEDLIIIEIQFGELISEDDITRFEDIYNRI